MSTEKYFFVKEQISNGFSYFDKKTTSLIGREKHNYLKEKTSNGFSYFNEKTILLIDRIVQLIDFKILSALFFLAAVTLGVSYIWVQQTPQNIIFTPEQISYLTLPDTRVQSTFYRFYCVVIFSFFLFAGLFTPKTFQPSNNSGWHFSSVIPKRFLPWLAIAFWTFIAITYGIKARDFLLAFAAAYLMKETIEGRFRTRTIAISLFSLVLLIYILPLGLPYELFDSRLFSMDIHWSAVIGEGLYTNTLTGWEFDAFSNYGVFLNKLIASSRLIPLFETLGGTVTFLKLISLIFFGLIVVVICQRIGMKDNRMVWAAALLILFIFSGRISGVPHTFDAPNQLPIRILIVPITLILAYLLAGRRGCNGPVIFGLIAPAFVFYNFETSFYCILGMGLAFFFESARKGTLSVIMAGTAFTVSFLLSGVLLMLALFDGTLGTVFAKLIQIMEVKIESGTSGFAGLSFYFFPPFIWIMAHIFVLFSRYLLSIKDRKQLSPVEFQNIVMIGMIIAIGPYVMNRFSSTNIFVPALLYTLLVLPKLAEGLKANRVLWSFILIVLIIPFIFGNPIKRLWAEDVGDAMADKIKDRNTPCLDSITASDKLCDYTLEKADELKRLASKYPGLEWLSGLSLNMARLTGTQPALTQRAPFFYAHRKETRDILVASLRQLRAPIIAIDNVAYRNIAGLPPVLEDFQRNLVRDAGYQIIAEAKYWIVARRQEEG